MTVISVDVFLDFGSKFFDALECSAPDRFLGDDIEPDLNLIQPGCVGGRVMNVPSLMQSKPAFHLRMFMRGIVVNNHMDIKILRNVLVKMLQER